eukprot:2955148-Alexandrium_andersonii.AAC.1
MAVDLAGLVQSDRQVYVQVVHQVTSEQNHHSAGASRTAKADYEHVHRLKTNQLAGIQWREQTAARRRMCG